MANRWGLTLGHADSHTPSDPSSKSRRIDGAVGGLPRRFPHPSCGRARAGAVPVAVGRWPDPYEWLARAVATPVSRVLDIGCGSGAMTEELAQPGRVVVGVDLSREELLMAAQRSPGLDPGQRATPAHRGCRLRRRRLRDGTCRDPSFGPSVVRGDAGAAAQGVFAALMPTTRPLQRADFAVAGQITRILRTTPRFPGALEPRLDALFLAHGLRRVETARERYRFTVASREDASELMQAMYLPLTEPARVQRAVEWLAEEAAVKGSVEVPIPMRRIVVIK